MVHIWCFQQRMLQHKRSMSKQGDPLQNFFQLLYGLPKHIKWCGKNQNRDNNPEANFSIVARTCWGLQLSQSLFVPFWDWTKLRFDKNQPGHNFINCYNFLPRTETYILHLFLIWWNYVHTYLQINAPSKTYKLNLHLRMCFDVMWKWRRWVSMINANLRELRT